MDKIILSGPEFIDHEGRGFPIHPIGEVVDYRNIDNIPDLMGSPTRCDATHPLIKLINKFDIDYGLEVGVEKGHLSENVLLNTKIEKWYMLDSWHYEHAVQWVKSGDRLMQWKMGFDGGMEPNQRRLDYIFQEVKKRFIPWRDRSQIIRWFSPEGAALFKRNSLDLVFLDTLHFWDQLYAEIDEWRKVIRPGGILSGDDISPYYCDVEKCVRAWFGDRVNIWGRVWWVKLEEYDVV